MNYERPFYEDINHYPMLHYVVFGVNTMSVQISKTKHKTDGVPRGLNVSQADGQYKKMLFDGEFGKLLHDKYGGLYDNALKTDRWVVFLGRIINDEDLNYLRSTIGLVEAFAENTGEGAAILDVLTFTMYTPEEWRTKVFDAEFDCCSHVNIFVSRRNNGTMWLHTRGMFKFGRPDVGFENVPEDKYETAVKLVNQMIFYGAQGAVFGETTNLNLLDMKCTVFPHIDDDFQNPDYNNAHYKILWEECKFLNE